MYGVVIDDKLTTELAIIKPRHIKTEVTDYCSSSKFVGLNELLKAENEEGWAFQR